MKQVIFNVGGALSSYLQIGDKRIIIDLGKSSYFSPVNDFLKPLFEKQKVNKMGEKYIIDQIILSHPHDDHISDIDSFEESCYANLVTTPNDSHGMLNSEKINWRLIEITDYVKTLKNKILIGRTPPLKSFDTNYLNIHYLKSLQCEKSPNLDVKNYPNNISIVTVANINGHRILMPGDIMKDGMDYLITNYPSFKEELGKGIDILITPHHGLRSSFSTSLFNDMKGKKVKRLNVVSEKVTKKDDTRQVDSRYSSTDFCEGKNNLSNTSSIVCQIKTSGGHIFIDYSNAEPYFEVFPMDKINLLINKFV